MRDLIVGIIMAGIISLVMLLTGCEKSTRHEIRYEVYTNASVKVKYKKPVQDRDAYDSVMLNDEVWEKTITYTEGVDAKITAEIIPGEPDNTMDTVTVKIYEGDTWVSTESSNEMEGGKTSQWIVLGN